MSLNLVSRRKLRTVLLWIAVSLALVTAIWLSVIAWWQMTQRQITTTDALLYLGVLPLGALLCTGLLFWRLSARRPLKNMGQPSTVPAECVSSDDAPVIEMQAQSLPILTAWAITSLSSIGDEFIESLAEQRHRPNPDESLTDSHGFPLLTGRVKDLDTASVERRLHLIEPDLAQDGICIDNPRDAFLRLLALLDSLLEQAEQDWPLLSIASEEGSKQESIATLRGALTSSTAAAAPLILHVKLLVSEELESGEALAAQAYVTQRLSTIRALPSVPRVEVIGAANDTKAIMLANEFGRETLCSHGADVPQALLLLAAESTLCDTIVERWEVQERLFDPRRPEGLMPGEGAFGILCANRKAMDVFDALPFCYLASVAFARREVPTSGRDNHECLAELINSALTRAGVSAGTIGTVVCDADHRTSRTLESIEAMLSHIPHLDAIQNRIATNQVCGHVGAASALSVLAAGALRADSAGHPVLLLNVSHANERAAAVALPINIERIPDDIQTPQAA